MPIHDYCPTLPILLAQIDVKDFSRGFQRENQDWTMSIVFAVLIAGIAVLLVWVWRKSKRGERPQSFDSHDHLFLELSRAHVLSHNERQLLRQIATQLGVHPGLLFVRPELFQEGVDKLPAQTEETKEMAIVLKSRLFAAPTSEPVLELPTEQLFVPASTPLEESDE